MFRALIVATFAAFAFLGCADSEKSSARFSANAKRIEAPSCELEGPNEDVLPLEPVKLTLKIEGEVDDAKVLLNQEKVDPNKLTVSARESKDYTVQVENSAGSNNCSFSLKVAPPKAHEIDFVNFEFLDLPTPTTPGTALISYRYNNLFEDQTLLAGELSKHTVDFLESKLDFSDRMPMENEKRYFYQDVKLTLKLSWLPATTLYMYQSFSYKFKQGDEEKQFNQDRHVKIVIDNNPDEGQNKFTGAEGNPNAKP